MDKPTAAGYLSGYLDAEISEQWAQHIARCAACQEVVEEVSGLFEDVRQALMVGSDVRFDSAEIPDPDQVRRRRQFGFTRIASPRSFARRLKQARLLPSFRAERWRMFALPSGLVLAAVVVGFVIFYGLASRSVLHAEEILRRAELAAGLNRSTPGRVLHRGWKDSLINGLGPLPDGDYRIEGWWDNVDHRYAFTRRDTQGHLRFGNWLLPDGTSYTYVANDEAAPTLAIGPADTAVREEIDRLPEAVRGRVREAFERSRRPFYESAADLAAQVQKEVTDAKSTGKGNSSVHEVVLPSGQKVYRVTTHVESNDEKIPHWDVTRLIVDHTFATIEQHRTGYRRDGLIYHSDQILAEDQVLVPDAVSSRVFEPGPFPPATQIRKVSPRERIEIIQRQLGL